MVCDINEGDLAHHGEESPQAEDVAWDLLGGWVSGWIEEKEAVRMSCCTLGLGGGEGGSNALLYMLGLGRGEGEGKGGLNALL